MSAPDKNALRLEAKKLAEDNIKKEKEQEKELREFEKSVATQPDAAKQIRAKVKAFKDERKKAIEEVKEKIMEARKAI